MSTSGGNGRFPTNDAQARSKASRSAPLQQATDSMSRLVDAQTAGKSWGNGPHRGESPQDARQRRQAQRAATNNRTKSVTKNGGGFNPSINPTVSINLGKGGDQATTAGQAAGPGNATPGGDFMSNEDIRAWCEHVRKAARNRAVERSMDAEQLEAVLKRIPTSDGSRAGSMMRARRVSRHLKRIARAEQVVAKAAAAAYAQFEREYESELRKVSKARPAQPARFTF